MMLPPSPIYLGAISTRLYDFGMVLFHLHSRIKHGQFPTRFTERIKHVPLPPPLAGCRSASLTQACHRHTRQTRNPVPPPLYGCLLPLSRRTVIGFLLVENGIVPSLTSYRILAALNLPPNHRI
ncbi:hypothetical protein BU23DRAFT_62592 [Bimuria novae-zelandiae CBS 107.79]|uniref:Uncharacterized protein n=1 Tax=Bimuria novae-zelandiae CBS 107.79 TaxID=1447943 RepID=A0A6A5UNB7_9PLEO|nr:hypothetical protein BU23DRAFT_62592 [Bimuria novae-zelandiae CBS 107.79]